MEYRNPQKTAGVAIDCEINHPTFGWIPFTADPSDTGAAFDVASLYAALVADPSTLEYVAPPPAPPPPAPTVGELMAKLEEIQAQILALQADL